MLSDKQQMLVRVLLQKGINLQAGQPLVLDVTAQDHELVEFAMSEASHMGVQDVTCLWRCTDANRLYLYGEADKDGIRQDISSRVEQAVQSGGAYLRLDNPEYEVFSSMTPEQLNRLNRNSRAVGMLFRQNPDCTTCLACIPTVSWAAKVFPDQAPEKALAFLWQAVFRCCRIDEDDPLAAWGDYLKKTEHRKKMLNSRNFVKYHYTSAVTDLYLRPAQGECWNGGCMENAKGIPFVPNIPTEEIFCCPDRESAQGHVCSTLPLYVRGQRIDNFCLSFEEGRVTDFYAEFGQKILAEILASDDGTSRLGEFALVAQGSPIAQTGLVYCTTLYDENASCHLALGMGGNPSLSEPERRRRGMNTSGLHVDFMIGSDDMRIQGMTADGRWEDIFIDGRWAPAYSFS